MHEHTHCENIESNLRQQILDFKRVINDLLENMGGHNHWDAQGNHGATCPVCIQQGEARSRAREILANYA